MFNFMKKGEEKVKRKKEKKKRDREDLLSGSGFEDVRRSLKLKKRKEKLPSGITADYSDFFSEASKDLENRSGSLPGYASRSDSSETSLNSFTHTHGALPPKMLPPLPPRPPKRGILKGSRNSVNTDIYEYDSMSASILARNTLQNEVITYQNVNQNSLQLSTDKTVGSSAESLTDTTNSSFATPPLLSPTDLPPLPPLHSINLPPPVDLTIQRTPRGDFGFQLRRAIVNDKLNGVTKKGELLAEPGTLGGIFNETGLLPGDALLEVNGVSIQDKSREEIIDMIKSSGTSVQVKVQPIRELSELTQRCRVSSANLKNGNDVQEYRSGTLKRSGSQRFKNTKSVMDRRLKIRGPLGSLLDLSDPNVKFPYKDLKHKLSFKKSVKKESSSEIQYLARSEEELAKERAWLETEKFWLVHRGGYSAVTAIKSEAKLDSGKVKVKLENSEEILEVQEEDLEKANPNDLDTIEDLSDLRYINESSILHVLRMRYANNLIHTYAAGNLIVLNPDCSLSIYNDKVASLFRGCNPEDMPPHIYSIAQSAYRSMVLTKRDQGIVLLGRSGSGKTQNFRHVLSYLMMISGNANNAVTIDKINALNVILEAFCNLRTGQNANASRSTNLISLDFDQSRQIVSASVQILMVEKERVARRPTGEDTFNVINYLINGAEGSLARQLGLDSGQSADNSFMPPIKSEDRQKHQVEFSKLCLAMATLGITEREATAVWSVLGAIYHLGLAGVVKVGTNKWQFADPASAARTCRLLGIITDELSSALWDGPRSSTRAAIHENVEGSELLEGFALGLYGELINVVNYLINRSLTSSINTSTAIVIVDSPGFQTPPGSSRFSDLCHNYVQERFHALYHNTMLIAPLDRYDQERIDINAGEIQSDSLSPLQLVNILDKSPPGGVVKTSQPDLREADRRGIFWIIEEENVFPNGNDETLLQHILQQYGSKEYSSIIRKCTAPGQITINHKQGSCPINYNVNGWLKASREPHTVRGALTVLQESSREDISELFIIGRGGGGMFTMEGTSQSLRRVSSIRRTCSVAVKRKSIGLQVKHTTDSVIETLRRTQLRFVFCFSTQMWSGTNDSLLNVPLLRSQIRGTSILPSIRLYKQGYPGHIPHGEFIRRFKLLAGCDVTTGNKRFGSQVSPIMVTVTDHDKKITDEVSLVEAILFNADIDEASCKIGLSEVFFRAGALPKLENQRDEKLSGLITRLQSHCRGHLARKKLAKLKVQDTAVRCIQRNVRKLMMVREWSWWKLYVKIAPLLNVHRTEEELSERIHELGQLKGRLEKLETENQELRLDKDKLEAKLNEMTLDLAEERSGCSAATERLEAETVERIRLEQEVTALTKEKAKLEEASEKMELELYYAKADINGLGEGDHDWNETGDVTIYKQKCERMAREIGFLRGRLQQQHEDDLEQLVGLKKQLEKKLADAYEEVEEQRQVAAQWKKKYQKLQAEMSDLRLILEEQTSRNNLLEKKQRKFDSELQMLHEELRSEKNIRDRISREREVAVGEKYAIEQSLSSVRLELELKEEKLGSLTRELEDLSLGSASEQDITQLRKIKHDLEMKIKEQEDELDDLAGQVSLLESAKLKLEMSLENTRKEHRKEMNAKDEEIEDTRSNLMKKIKAVEALLEQEHEERSLLVREKHELERRLKEAEDRGRHSRAAEEDVITRLRRDLRKTKALLRDAQIMLERAKQDSPNKAAIRTLRNQLEDLELARASAVKAKQTLESELNDVTCQLEEANRAKTDSETKCQAALREVSSLRSQVDENEEEMAELMKKYRQGLQQLSQEQTRYQELTATLADLESERASLREQLAELTARLETTSIVDPANSLLQRRLEIRVKELESRLELEGTIRARLEGQVSRLKENIERLTDEGNQARIKEQNALEQVKKLQRNLRDCREELSVLTARDQDNMQRKRELEKRLEVAEQETATARNDLRLQIQRVQDLQEALAAEISSDSEATSDSDTGDESLTAHTSTR